VQNGYNGFLCENLNEWEKNLENLLQNPEKRKILGANARKTIIERYSVQANTSNFLNLFV